MGKVYSAPKGYEAPEMDFANFDFDKWKESENKYIERLATLLKQQNPKDPRYVGQVLKFPAADGYALYMVASLNPVELVWLQLGDAWQFEYAHRLTKEDIIDKIDSERRMSEFLASRQG